jgi:hypothetical protein
MPLDPDFAADSPYGPGGLLLDAILEVDRSAQRLVGQMPTSDDLPLTCEQRAHPQHHPRHVSGGLMVHMTGMIGFAHAYYILDLRHSDGWIGYGGKIYAARFHALAPPGTPLQLEVRATEVRSRGHQIFARYLFRFTQGDTLVYTGDQAALWINTNHNAADKTE